MNNKEKYNLLCQTEGARIPLFMQHWWLDAVCAGKLWEVALVEDAQGHIQAAMPYLLRRRGGMRYVLQPQLTPYCGPWYRHPEGATAAQKVSFEHHAARSLIQQVEVQRLAYFQQNFAPGVGNALPFYWAGYEATVRYTYVLPDISDPQRVFASFDAEQRQRKIRKLQGRFHLEYDTTSEALAALHQRYWQWRGRRNLLSPQLITGVCQAALQRGQGLILTLADERGDPVVSRFIVYDEHCAHAMFSAHNPDCRVANANDVLVWLSICELAGRTRAYDFEGSMDAGIEHYYRSFGAVQVPYLSVSRCRNPLFRILLAIKSKTS